MLKMWYGSYGKIVEDEGNFPTGNNNSPEQKHYQDTQGQGEGNVTGLATASNAKHYWALPCTAKQGVASTVEHVFRHIL